MIKGITWILALIPNNISHIAAINISIIIDLFWGSELDVLPLGIFVNAFCLQKFYI